MLKILTTAKGPKQLEKKFHKAGKGAPKSIERSMQRSLRLVANTMKRNLTGGNPLHVRTNRLRGSVATEIKKRGFHIEGAAGTNVKYGAVHEYGKTIMAKSGAMRFPIKGHWVTVQKVTIPKRPWAEPALSSNMTKINEIFGRDMNRYLRKAGLA